MSELPCPGCEGEPMSPDCGLCGGSGTLPDATPVVRRFLAPTHTLDLDNQETVERLARALHSLSHHYRGGADEELARFACVQFGWDESGCVQRAAAILAALREGTA